eukprot:CAMPEP_0115580690 /NCGR_PEP_ID=MMETSP0272-20121206/4761_1 /TAXON_ID=71861 /ORGANISM="Scrippsiella trochoidea, Strain CCMP3099" /LENGTH=219 /DNA_ID=CAMNT_0003015627 /DNA_START=207 /DNA_END=864 /DNA_ORIENTATION=-
MRQNTKEGTRKSHGRTVIVLAQQSTASWCRAAEAASTPQRLEEAREGGRERRGEREAEEAGEEDAGGALDEEGQLAWLVDPRDEERAAEREGHHQIADGDHGTRPEEGRLEGFEVLIGARTLRSLLREARPEEEGVVGVEGEGDEEHGLVVLVDVQRVDGKLRDDQNRSDSSEGGRHASDRGQRSDQTAEDEHQDGRHEGHADRHVAPGILALAVHRRL